jgi:nucleoside phosphorylase
MIYCAGESESFTFAKPIGIGMIDVSMNLTQICIEKPPAFILFVGTAGSYGEKNIFDIIESKTATNIENSFFGGGSYTPIDNMITTSEDVSRETMVNSSNYITTDAKCAKHYIAQNIHLENMEFFAVLKVAEKFSIPAAGIFIVTNYCDENAHETFKQNHAEAMMRLTEYMSKKVDN